MGIDLSQHNLGIVATAPRQVESQTHDKGALYHFYDVRDKKGKQVKDYPDYYKILISQATQIIRIWDPYFHEDTDCEVFKAVTASNVDILIVTSLMRLDDKMRPQDNQSVDDYCKFIERNLPGTVATASISIRAYKHNDWHDRFLIIDDRYFLVGASVYNQYNNYLSHGIFEVTDTLDKKLILDKFNQYFATTAGSYKKVIHRPQPTQTSKKKKRNG